MSKKAHTVVLVPCIERDEEVYVYNVDLTPKECDDLVEDLHELTLAGDIYNYKIIPGKLPKRGVEETRQFMSLVLAGCASLPRRNQ